MKVGEARECALNAAALAAKDKPLEARLFGYSVLHSLVRPLSTPFTHSLAAGGTARRT
jgi:hypothetical protein